MFRQRWNPSGCSNLATTPTAIPQSPRGPAPNGVASVSITEGSHYRMAAFRRRWTGAKKPSSSRALLKRQENLTARRPSPGPTKPLWFWPQKMAVTRLSGKQNLRIAMTHNDDQTALTPFRLRLMRVTTSLSGTVTVDRRGKKAFTEESLWWQSPTEGASEEGKQD